MSNNNQSTTVKCILLLSLSLSFSINGIAAPQDDEAPKSKVLEEIIVTARKRDETITSVPVAITSVSGAELDRLAINDFDRFASLVPTLQISEGSGGNHSGGIISLRGIQGAAANPFGSSTVSFSIDNVQNARPAVRRAALFDVEQIDVLKGPQALFFGKNSPGGIIAIRTADPTEQFSGGIKTGYEFNAEEWRTEGHIAGPLTDTLSARLAGYYTEMNGWLDNIVPADAIAQPRDDEQPDQENFAVRGTLLWEPNERFTARFKWTQAEADGPGNTYNSQFVFCPVGGRPQNGSIDECKANDKVSVADLGPGFAPFRPGFGNDGETFLKQDQEFASLELNYQINDLTLTSVTGWYESEYKSAGNYTNSYIPSQILTSMSKMQVEEWQQEFRLHSNYDGPFNFTVGAHYYEQLDASIDVTSMMGYEGSLVFGVFPAPQEFNQYIVNESGDAWSVYGQVIYDLTPELELSLGVRHSEEQKSLDDLLVDIIPPFGDGAGGTIKRVTPPVRVFPSVDEREWNNTSPEVALTWRPSDTLTYYLSYKEGFLSGGFNASTGVTNTQFDPSYDEEEIDGYEVGVKALLFDGTFRTALAFFDYDITGKQVIVVRDNVVFALQNAGEVGLKGIEWDFDWSTPVEGLLLRGQLAWTDGEYDDYQATCYLGQNAFSNPPCVNQLSRVTGTVSLLQDLSGTELLVAPEWTGSLGFVYETPLTSFLKLTTAANVRYSDDYLTDASSREGGRSPSYHTIDASISLSDINDVWEVALIGTNLNEEWWWTESNDVPFTGTTAGVVPGVLGDNVAGINRGRQIMLQASYRF